MLYEEHEEQTHKTLRWCLISNPDYDDSPIWFLILTFPLKAIFLLVMAVILLTPIVVPWLFLALWLADLLGVINWPGATPERMIDGS